MKRLLKFLVALVVIVLLAGIGAGTWIYARLPDLDATLTCPQLTQPATVTRDRWGVPHVQAQNGKDAYFAYGYTIAQDRLFQMELQRRMARGELAEILGPKLIDVDKMFRTYMLRRWAESQLADTGSIDPEALGLLDAFLAGVNHFVDTGALPVEFTLLGTRPRHFTRIDTLSVLAYVAYSFADGIRRDSLYTMLKSRLTPQDLARVFPDYAAANHVAIIDSVPKPAPLVAGNTPPDPSKPGNLDPLLAVMDAAAEVFPAFEGSNSWVMAPHRSATQTALLANDPHIGIANPGVWYEAHIQYPGYENYGYHLALMPFPMLAHNRDKAWAVTMFENDDLDLYAETFHPDDAGKVMYRGRWTAVETLSETIGVKGGSAVPLTIRVTPHGPIISDFIKGYTGKPVALWWVFHHEKNPILDVVYDVARAKTVAELGIALADLAAPGLNFSYADRRGNIAWWAAGRLPVRPGHVTGKEILDGASGKDEILGYVPFEQNPHLINPTSGIIVTANNISSFDPVGSIERLRGYFRPSDRAGRILELLEKKKQWSVEDLKAVQTDTTLWAGIRMTSQIIAAIRAEGRPYGKTATQALDSLAAWDGSMETDTVGGSVFQFTTYHILKQALGNAMGEVHLTTYLNLVDHWDFLKILLTTEGPVIRGKSASGAAKNMKVIVADAFDAAVAELTARLGDDVNGWQWGNIHRVEWVHPVGRKKPLDKVFNVGPLPCPAEFTSVNKLKSKTGRHDYKVASLPSTRRIIDCGAPDRSQSILPTGNSGNFLSPYYKDQVHMYVTGKYRPMVFTDEQLADEKAHTLTLLPPGG
jgi:penicillin G amidase